MKYNLRTFAIATFLFGLFTPMMFLSASQMQPVSSTSPATVGREVAVELFLDTELRAVNALSGEVVISGGATINRIRDGDSIVGAWLTKATTADPTRTSFSGIIPGGITTAHGKVITVYLVPQKAGILTLLVTGSTFENGASGASSTLYPSTLSLSVRAAGDEATTSTPQDTTPPEDIKTAIYQNEEMFDGKPFVIINAKDTESGIATYELLETAEQHPTDTLTNDSRLPWHLIKNPAPLPSSGTLGFIYLRITDREGNAAVVLVSHPLELSPEKPQNLFNKWLILAILIGAAGLFLWFWYRRRTHHAQ